MARSLTVRQEDIMRLEGLAQKLSDYEPEDRPKAEAAQYIAQHLGISRAIVRDWVRLARPATRRNDTAAAFFSVYERIADLLSENLHARVHAMSVPGQRDAFKAAMWLLARIWPDEYDPKFAGAEAPDDDVFSTAGISQEVFDALTDEEREAIAGLRATMHECMERYEVLMQQAQARVIAQDLAQRTSDR
jgi:hypothetical protein